jgi:hypothetical protein
VTGVVFTANNSGNVVSGSEEVNDSVSGPATNTINGGSYAMDSSGDGRGVLTLTSSTAVTRTFRFVLESTANPGVGQIEEFDSTGTLGSGVLFGPETAPIAQIPANTVVALPTDGINGSGQRSGLLGDFQVGSSGCNGASGSFNSFGSQVVTNTVGKVNTGLTITGSCTASDPNTGVGTAQMTISGGSPYTNATLNFVYIALGSSSVLQGALFLETDPIAANQPILSGLAEPKVPVGKVNAARIACTNISPVPACLFVGSGTTDGTITGHVVGTISRVITSPGAGASGTLTGVVDQNAGGTITRAGSWPYSAYTTDPNGVGTITGTGPIIHFVISGDTLHTLDESQGVETGSIRQQNATTIQTPSSGAPYIVGLGNGELIGLTPSTANVVGVVTPSGASVATMGTLPGTVDISSSAGNLAGVAASGSYAIDSTTGRGTGTANLTGSPGSVSVIIYARRGRQFVVLDVQSIDPVLLGARLQ